MDASIVGMCTQHGLAVRQHLPSPVSIVGMTLCPLASRCRASSNATTPWLPTSIDIVCVALPV